MDLKKIFSITKPCGNCPFRNDSKAIQLAPGRVEGIVNGLEADDNQIFHCHKSVHSKDGGEFNDDTGLYESSGNEKVCRGALVYMMKRKRLPVLARIALAFGVLKIEDLEAQFCKVIDKPS
ncbi:MAG: hypothetical protein ACTS9Y_00095 [Methylophilus sp.]|uniref:hypothetical protein n=1 Tax=Methylophilus sp. TaxID=29541 RepID=UPI003FA0A9F7